MTLTIARFTSPSERIQQRETFSWMDFVGLFSAPRSAPCSRATCPGSACPHKRGSCWSPVAHAGEGAATSLIVFDVDHATDEQLDEIRGRIGDLRYLIHSTHSDGPDWRYLRVIFPLSRSIAPDALVSLWWDACVNLVPIADPACADVRRVYFFPSCPSDASYFMQVNEGLELDVDSMLATALSG